MTWSFTLPDRLKIAIAEAVTIFSHVDCMVIESVWVLADLRLRCRCSTRSWRRFLPTCRRSKPSHEQLLHVREVAQLGGSARPRCRVRRAFPQPFPIAGRV
jgi:hypothetical protein